MRAQEPAVNDNTTEVRPEARFDEPRLEEYLRVHLPDYAGALSVRQFKGGQSNPSFLLATAHAQYVLRRKPAGQLLSSAHAVDREYRVTTALSRHTDIPVARTHLYCADDSIIGSPFYLMDYVPGRIFWDTSFPQVNREQRSQYFDAMNATLAALHRVDPVAAGLSDYGRPLGYVPRQIERWSKQYAQDEIAGRVPALERMIEWLPAHLPAAEESSIVHGDFRCDNLIFHPTEPRVLAVIDWELSTLGHPVADFAYHLLMYRMPTLAFPGLLGLDLQALGIPAEHIYVSDYCRRTGRAALPTLDFFLVFCFFRLAGIFHGIRARNRRGNASSANAESYARHVERIAELGWQLAQGGGGE